MRVHGGVAKGVDEVGGVGMPSAARVPGSGILGREEWIVRAVGE